MEEDISCIETEVIADFEQDYTIETMIKRIDFPIKINMPEGFCVYGKKEYFELYLKECEWRFNHSELKSQISILKQLVKSNLA